MTNREVIEPLVKKHAGFFFKTIMGRVEKEFADLDKPYVKQVLIQIVQERFPMMEKFINELPE